MTLYHVTKKENLDNIFTEGLIPLIGENSKKVYEEKTAIFLSEEENLWQWVYLLKGDIVLKINNIDDTIEKFNYSDYTEYICYEKIEPKNIEIYSNADVFMDNEKIKYLLIGYIYTINKICINSLKVKENADDLNHYLNSMKAISNINLEYTKYFKAQELVEQFIEIGESGEYTIFDSRIGTNVKAYEELKSLNNKIANNFHNFILKSFPNCLDLCTGGWE